MRMVKGFMVVVIGLAVPLLAHAAVQRLARAGSADVNFVAIGPGGIKIVGRSGELRVRDGGESVTASVPLRTLDTGIGSRDEHMRRYLEVDKHPDADFTVSRGALRFPAGDAETSGEASGTMTLHGRQRPVKFDYQAKRQGSALKVVARLKVDMRDFGIEEIKYLGLKVRSEVQIAVAFGLTEN